MDGRPSLRPSATICLDAKFLLHSTNSSVQTHHSLAQQSEIYVSIRVLSQRYKYENGRRISNGA